MSSVMVNNQVVNPALYDGEDYLMTPFSHGLDAEQWEVVMDVPRVSGNLEAVNVVQETEHLIYGLDFLNRALEIPGVLGQKNAEFLFSNQHRIPSEWIGHHVTFPGTIWWHPVRGLCIPALNAWGDCWRFTFELLDARDVHQGPTWSGIEQVARHCSPAVSRVELPPSIFESLMAFKKAA